MAVRSQSNVVISSGYIILVSTDEVYSYGKDDESAHGHQEEVILTPTKIPSLKNIVSVDCGGHHTICLDKDGGVFSFGSNTLSQLGVKKSPKELKFTHLPQKIDVPPIKQIVCGYVSSICISTNDEMFSFGSNFFGQLGLGHNQDCDCPKKVESLKNIDFVSCGEYHSICKTLDNQIYVWGKNEELQLGLGEDENPYSPTKCEDCPDDVVDAKCGNEHTILLTSSGDVYSCGNNEESQLGREDDDEEEYAFFRQIEGLSDIIRIECGETHTICIDMNNEVFVFGDNSVGQLGLGDTDYKEPEVHQNLSLHNIVDISKGGSTILVKTLSNEIFGFGSCGENFFSGAEESEQPTPIQILKGNEDIWYSNIGKSKAKSARSLPEKENEEEESPPKKKQKTELNESIPVQDPGNSN